MSGIGHNSGRVDEPGKSWRTHAWSKARVALMPKLPIEIVRRRVARAKELGLPYKTYAGLRAASGDDLIGFMFSSNALDVIRRGDVVPAVKRDKIDGLRDVQTIGVVHKPALPSQVTPPLDVAVVAPKPLAPWVETRDAFRVTFAGMSRPASRFVLVYETALEADWAEAGRMAGAIPAPRYFEDAR